MDNTVTTYLLDIKKIIETLATIGALLTIANHIEVIIDGHPKDYYCFVTSITTGTTPYTMEELKTFLLAP